MEKSRIALSTLSDLHVAYVGNGSTAEQIMAATKRVQHLDATRFLFGETFKDTLALNSPHYEVFDDVGVTAKEPVHA